MKVTIIKIDATTYNFQEEGKDLVVLTDKDIVLEKKTGAYWLKLPENSLNRKLINTKKFDESSTIVLENVKTPVTITRSNWMDYLTEEEKDNLTRAEEALEAMRTEYKREAMARKDSQKEAPMTKEEKLRAKIAKLEAQLAEMESEEA